MNILVVCAGNTCRSPMAAGFLRAIGGELRRNIFVRSEGLAHHPGKRVAQNAVTVMKELKIDISDEYSKPVSEESLRWADVILTIQARHCDYILEDYPWVERKLRVLERDIRDPYHQPIERYREVRDELKDLLWQFVERLATDPKSSSSSAA